MMIEILRCGLVVRVEEGFGRVDGCRLELQAMMLTQLVEAQGCATVIGGDRSFVASQPHHFETGSSRHV